MAWDIYGQPLAPGTCEVHIGYPEPWPCVNCRDEMDQEAQRHEHENPPGPCEGCHYVTGAMQECDGSCNTIHYGPEEVPW